MKQVMEKQASEPVKQSEPPKQEAHFTLRAWLLKKLIQYADNTFQTLFTGGILGGALWVVQHLWGLRLVPFNILDTVLIAVGVALAILALTGGMLWLILRWALIKQPGIFILFGLMALLPYLASRNPDLFKTFNKTAAPASAGASAQEGNATPEKSQSNQP